MGVSQSLTLLIELYQQLQHILPISYHHSSRQYCCYYSSSKPWDFVFFSNLSVFLHLPTCFTTKIIENNGEYHQKYLDLDSDDFNQVAA